MIFRHKIERSSLLKKRKVQALDRVVFPSYNIVDTSDNFFFLFPKHPNFATENQKKMPRFILNDEKQTNSYGFKIKTEGINLKRFKANPVMLDGHSNMNLSVIGKWKDIRKEDGKLSAETEFDTDDANANIIESKVKKGIIKGASMGVSFHREDMSYENGELVLNHCELYEASIVAIPSNANALRLTMDGEELNEMEIKSLCLSIAQNSEDFKPNKFNTIMKIRLSQLAFLALGFEAKTQEASQEQIDTAVLKLQQERDALKSQLALSEEKVNAYVAKEQEQRKALSMELVEVG